MTIPKGFFPQQDTGFIFGEVDTRQDDSFAVDDRDLAHQIVDIVKQDPAVQGVFSLGGAYAYNPTENTARVFIQLKPFDERDVTADQVIQRLRPQVAQVQGAKFFMQAGQDINIGGRLSRTQYQYTLTDTDLDELNHWAPILEQGDAEAAGAAGCGVRPAGCRAACRRSRSIATPPRGLALSAIVIDQTLYDAFRPAPGRDDLHRDQSVQGRAGGRAAIPPGSDDPVEDLCRGDPPGAQVPLSAFAHFTSKLEPLSVSHQGQFPAVTLSFNLAPGTALGPGRGQHPGPVAPIARCRRR